MTRNHLPMPPVRIVPAPTSSERTAAEHDAQSREAGNRFRRLLDAQQRRATVPPAPFLSEHRPELASMEPPAEPPFESLSAPPAEREARPEHKPDPEDEPERDAHAHATAERETGRPSQGEAEQPPRYGKRAGAQLPAPLSASLSAYLSASLSASLSAPLATSLTATLAGNTRRLPSEPPRDIANRQRDAGEDSGPRMSDTGRHDSDAHERAPRTFQPPFVSQLERDVVEFCGAGELPQDAAERTITITPDPRVLPETRLELRISRDALSLRFHSEAARSRELLCLHGDTLKSRLALRTGRTIELEVVAG